MIHISENSLLNSEASQLNGKFLLTVSFGQFPPTGGEQQHYSPNPGEKDKLLTEMSSCFRVTLMTLSV